MHRLLDKLWRFAGRGNRPGLPPEQRLRQSLLTLIVLFVSVLALGWGVLYWLAGYAVASVIPFAYAVMAFVSLGDYFIRRCYAFFRDTHLLLICLLPFLLMWSLGGFANSAAVVIWSLFSPLAAVFFADMKVARRWLAAFLVLIMVSGLLDATLRAHAPVMPPALNTAFFVLNLGLGSTGIFLALFYFVRESVAMRRDLEVTNEELANAYRELKRNEARIHELMLRDPLTGVHNRRALNERLTEELARSRRFGHPLALLMLDVDHFKAINDRYGHQTGDQVLTVIGRCLREHVRRIDFVARYGGEEFVILLPETDREGARRFAERLRQAVAALELGGELASPTVSIGVAVSREADTPDSLLQRADAALYAAKRAGRNRVMVAD